MKDNRNVDDILQEWLAEEEDESSAAYAKRIAKSVAQGKRLAKKIVGKIGTMDGINSAHLTDTTYDENKNVTSVGIDIETDLSPKAAKALLTSLKSDGVTKVSAYKSQHYLKVDLDIKHR